MTAMAELCDIEQSLASAVDLKSIAPEARELDIMVKYHHCWIGRM